MRKILHVLGLFLVSVSMMAQTSERNTFQYLSVKPEADSKVSSLKRVELIYKDLDKNIGAGVGALNYRQAATIHKVGSEEVLATGNYELLLGSDMFTMRGVAINFNREITEAGEYVVKVPEKSILNDKAKQYDTDFGIPNDSKGEIKYNPAIELKYIVKPEVGLKLEKTTPAIGEELEKGKYDVVLTFSGDVSEVESAMLKLGVNGTVELTAEDCIVKNYEVILNLKKYEEQLSQAGSFGILLKVKDTQGNYVTYGDMDGYILLQYEI